MTDKELGKNAEVRTLFSEKFLELSAACPCRRAASCQLCTGKSHGGAQLPLVKNTRNKIRHTHLSPSAESMKIVASISQKQILGGSGGDDEAGYGSEKGEK